MRPLLAPALIAALAAGCASTVEDQAVASMRDALAAAGRHDLDAAQAAAERASELRPGFVDPLMMLAAIAEQRGDFEEARRRYVAVLKADPTDTAAGVALGVTFIREQRYDEARSWFLKAIDADPGYEAAAFNMASLAEQQGELDTAVEWFDVAAALDRRDPRALARIANIRIAQDRAEDALASADAALQRYPRSQAAQEARARALAILGRRAP
jgi:tetratricopeptide (TPR) repeat protein